MTIHHKVRLVAGSFVLVSVALTLLVSPWWLLFTAFVGANLVQSAFTRWCPMEDLLAGRRPTWPGTSAGGR
jgi:hypothetical protein